MPVAAWFRRAAKETCLPSEGLYARGHCGVLANVKSLPFPAENSFARIGMLLRRVLG